MAEQQQNGDDPPPARLSAGESDQPPNDEETGEEVDMDEAEKPVKRKRGRRPMPVERVCLDTCKVLERYPSVQAAAKAMDITHCSISKCLNERSRCAGGFFWRYESSSALPMPSSHYLARKHDMARRRVIPGQLFNRKSVHKVCLTSGRILATYSSIRAAATEINVTGANIGNVIHGRAKSAGGYGWKLAGTNMNSEDGSEIEDVNHKKATEKPPIARGHNADESVAGEVLGRCNNDNDGRHQDLGVTARDDVHLAKRARIASHAPTPTFAASQNRISPTIPIAPRSEHAVPSQPFVFPNQSYSAALSGPPSALDAAAMDPGSLPGAGMMDPGRGINPISNIALPQLHMPYATRPQPPQVIMHSAQLASQLLQSERIRALESQVEQQRLIISSMAQMPPPQHQLQLRRLQEIQQMQQHPLDQLHRLQHQERILQTLQYSGAQQPQNPQRGPTNQPNDPSQFLPPRSFRMDPSMR